MARKVLYKTDIINTALVIIGWAAFILSMPIGRLNPILSVCLMVIARVLH